LILGLGKEMSPISPKTRQRINNLGIRIDIQDTRNAAAQFNLLATERGVESVAAALVPLGWREGVGIK
jgi:NADH dehydrogenase [ubiquinone] 1 alpha subcomplex assembly factor 3